MRWLSVVVLVVGCGRIGFEAHGDGGGGGPGDDGAQLPDATTACVPDGFCPPSCGATDPDCQTVCGDQQCVGNAGETCQTCTSDCRTTMAVCGNGACQPGENGTTCYFDCGPVPWTWTPDETALFSAINNARTSGTACGGGPVMTAPALTLDGGLHAAARDLAWEEAHLGSLGFNRCDGQSMIAYAASVNATSFRIATAATSTPARLASILGDSGTCTAVMSPNHTVIGVGIAIDQTTPYVVLLR